MISSGSRTRAYSVGRLATVEEAAKSAAADLAKVHPAWPWEKDAIQGMLPMLISCCAPPHGQSVFCRCLTHLRAAHALVQTLDALREALAE
jgi:hypothetical protein